VSGVECESNIINSLIVGEVRRYGVFLHIGALAKQEV